MIYNLGIEIAESKERVRTLIFSDVSKSWHSPLVLIGVPVQGYCSPLIHTRIKCSLADIHSPTLDQWIPNRAQSSRASHKTSS